MRPPEASKTGGEVAAYAGIQCVRHGELHDLGRQCPRLRHLDQVRIDVRGQYRRRVLCQFVCPVAVAAGQLEHVLPAHELAQSFHDLIQRIHRVRVVDILFIEVVAPRVVLRHIGMKLVAHAVISE
jgi:hypothetical protein